MARKYVLVDDYDGQELPDDTQPISLSYGNKRYALYLSDENHGKLLEALNPFIEGAEVAHAAPSRKETAKANKEAEKERNKAIREWAQATKFEYEGANGETRTLGDRGSIPEVVVKAYEEANG